ncbi:DKNYY domain-containing protein [Pedobacter nototheniae]|uniref:DKNYY domain-containing protein n=1 Tax=Pedobacter nototheniae TaxID=2488994 RepID=UPI002931A84A|nr:DKNYY domain-containing protein [Pedobacter nototheniae]
MTIPQLHIPDYVMTGMFGIYARRLLIEKITVTGEQITLNNASLMDQGNHQLLVDAATFSCINYGFFKDKNTIYGLSYTIRKKSERYYFTPLKNVDWDSFVPISMLYAKDQNHYYYAEGAKVITEEHLKPLSGYTSDYQDENFPDLKATHTWSSEVAVGQSFVYNRGLKLKYADAATFAQIGPHDYKDKYSCYVKDGLIIKRTV